MPDAGIADLVVCVARDATRSRSCRCEREPRTDLDADALDGRDAKLYEVAFDGVRVAGREALGADGDAAGALQGALDAATAVLCAEMVGGMQWVLDTTVEYAKTRQQFGRPIGSFQAVQHMCADMLLLTESARSAAYYAAWALTEHDPKAGGAVSVAKAYCSDAYREVANRGVQVHGGIGFTWEHDLQLYYKRGKSSETLFGDATYQTASASRASSLTAARREAQSDDGTRQGVFDLTGLVAIVTGGSRGWARRWPRAGRGRRVAVLCARREEWLAPTLEEFRGRGFGAEGDALRRGRPRAGAGGGGQDGRGVW